MRRMHWLLFLGLATSLFLEGAQEVKAQCTGQRSRAAGFSGPRQLNQGTMTGQQYSPGLQQLTTSSAGGTANLQAQQALATLQNDLTTLVTAGQLTDAQANQLNLDVNQVIASVSNPSTAIRKLATDLQTVTQGGTLSSQVTQALTADLNSAVQYALLSAQSQQGIRMLGGIR